MEPPIWTKEHDKIVQRYLDAKAKGKLKCLVIVPRDIDCQK